MAAKIKVVNLLHNYIIIKYIEFLTGRIKEYIIYENIEWTFETSGMCMNQRAQITSLYETSKFMDSW